MRKFSSIDLKVLTEEINKFLEDKNIADPEAIEICFKNSVDIRCGIYIDEFPKYREFIFRNTKSHLELQYFINELLLVNFPIIKDFHIEFFSVIIQPNGFCYHKVVTVLDYENKLSEQIYKTGRFF